MARVGPYGWLLASLIASVAVQGALPPSPVQRVVVSVLLGANLLLAVAVADVDRSVWRLAVAIAVAGVAVNTLRAAAGVVGEGEVRTMNALVVLLGPPMIVLGVLRNLRASRAVRVEAVSGVLSLYIMIGLFFAFVYGAIENLSGEPFFAGGTTATMSRCVYFSFVTLATVGYGDLTAAGDLGHTLCVFEALIGQIYLVTVVSLIVSNLGRREGPTHPDRMMRGGAPQPMLVNEVDATAKEEP
jgi:Ion channel